ncbi:MAG: amidohydrolase [Pseudobdellovibrio sp.]
MQPLNSIRYCYDSHTHFLATGQTAFELSLRHLKSAKDVKSLLIKPEHFRGEWLVGFGWNHELWEGKPWPHKDELDEVFPDTPVFLSRVDGHASWLNSRALKILSDQGYDLKKDPQGGRIARDNQGEPTGVLFDQAHIQALMMLPDYTDHQLESFLIRAGEIFNQGGFTHVRDLSMSYRQWKLQKKLTENKQLNIYCEAFITVESVRDLNRGYDEYQNCVSHSSPYLKVKGLKIFIDGSVGSKTAYLSDFYKGSVNKGILIWSKEDIASAIKFCWAHRMEIAIHAIGDEAVHIAAEAAREVSAEGLLGKIHIEHAQIVKLETLLLLKPLHVTVHMQPCQLLSDYAMLVDQIHHYEERVFQWELFRKNKIKLSFGSDSPIEPPLLMRNREALLKFKETKIPQFKDDWMHYHRYPTDWGGECTTKFTEDKILEVIFDGDVIVRN